MSFLLFILAGGGVGFIAGFFGVGGGLLMVPLLIFSYEYSGLSPSVLTHLALGTSLFVVIFASFMSAYQHNRQRTINWRAVFLIGFSSAVTALGTARFAAALGGKYLQVIFAGVVVVAIIRMLTEGQKEAEKKLEMPPPARAISLAGIGFATGVVSALAGVGGGHVIIPSMYNLLKYPLKVAIGTSSATIVITAFFSLVGYMASGLTHEGLPRWTLGYVDLWHGAALAMGSLFFARIGAYASYKMHPFRLRKAFVVFTLVVLTYMLVK
jgi:uncharacterized membrane protein YfcA